MISMNEKLRRRMTNAHTARCSCCNEMADPEFDSGEVYYEGPFGVQKGQPFRARWSSGCCDADLIDITDGGRWEPEGLDDEDPRY